jgi:hypothetical protein
VFQHSPTPRPSGKPAQLRGGWHSWGLGPRWYRKTSAQPASSKSMRSTLPIHRLVAVERMIRIIPVGPNLTLSMTRPMSAGGSPNLFRELEQRGFPAILSGHFWLLPAAAMRAGCQRRDITRSGPWRRGTLLEDVWAGDDPPGRRRCRSGLGAGWAFAATSCCRKSSVPFASGTAVSGTLGYLSADLSLTFDALSAHPRRTAPENGE